MKMLFLAAVFTSLLSACTSVAQNTVAQNTNAVDPLIEDCIGEGGSHQVCACTSLKLRTEIGDQTYSELLGVVARMAALKAQGLDAPVTDPQAGLGEYQHLLSVRWMLTQRENIRGLAYRANRDLCMAQSQN